MNLQHTKIQIIAGKLKSLKAELKTSKEIANTASRKIEDMFKQKFNKKLKETEKTKLHTNPSISTEETQAQTPHPPQSESTKKAFRSIALKTHPDKLVELIDGPAKERRKTLYQEASRALDDGDLMSLASISIDLGIEPPEITAEQVKEALEEINTIKKHLEHVESTYVWKWIFCHNKEEKKQILEKMFQIMQDRNEK